MSASKKLSALGHSDRAKALKDWASDSEKREELTKWKDHLQDYANFGTFKINIVNPETGEKITEDFALDINFDELAFEDSFEYEAEKDRNNVNGLSFIFFVGLIPTSEEVKEKWKKLSPESTRDPEICFRVLTQTGEEEYWSEWEWNYIDTDDGK